jgi:hypothetical protein
MPLSLDYSVKGNCLEGRNLIGDATQVLSRASQITRDDLHFDGEKKVKCLGSVFAHTSE